MKYGIIPKRGIFRNIFLKIYFTAGSFIILFILILYTNSLMRRIRNDVQIVPDLYSKFISLPADVNLESFLFQYFMSEIVPKINYPIILADSLKKPYSWENIRIEKDDYDLLDSKEKEYLHKKIRNYEARGLVIPLRYNLESDKILSYVYYGESNTMVQLRYLPYVEMIIVGLFIILGVVVLLSFKKNEENMLWIGLAKETAHQFGSPLSSLLGWRDIIESKLRKIGMDNDMINILDNMKVDIERLNKIASRFGKVGSTIKLAPVNLHDIILETIEYFKNRLPTLSKQINISFISKIQDRKIDLDPDLIKWTLENLIKNSIDSMQKNGGKIVITAFSYKKNTYIQIKDEGIGIPKSMFKRVFYPGVTTKKRGWGLGLSMARRIIEDYHKGKIHVLSSDLNRGSTLEIIIPED